MTILGNILLGLAALIYLVPLQFVLHDTSPKRNDGGGLLWAAIFLMLPLWFLLASALATATAKGGLDWTGRDRALQYLLVLICSVALMVVSGFSFVGKFEPPAQMPAITRSFAGWAVQLFPLITIAFCLLALNPGLGQSVPPLLMRVPMIAISGVSLVISVGLLFTLAVHSQQQAASRVEAEVEFHNKRDRDVLARVELITAEENFAELLGFANRFEKDHIRSIAIKKAEAHPKFTEELAQVLAGGWAEKGLVYLDACDAPDPKALAVPVRAAILKLAEDARNSVERTHTFYAEQFDWNTRIILSVADKFRDSGVDYEPAIREFRAAPDLPRAKTFAFNARRPLDAWLAKQAKGRQPQPR